MQIAHGKLIRSLSIASLLMTALTSTAAPALKTSAEPLPWQDPSSDRCYCQEMCGYDFSSLDIETELTRKLKECDVKWPDRERHLSERIACKSAARRSAQEQIRSMRFLYSQCLQNCRSTFPEKPDQACNDDDFDIDGPAASSSAAIRLLIAD